MSGNPYKIHEKVDGSTMVERATTTCQGSIRSEALAWRTEYEEDVLTLDEILEQATNRMNTIMPSNYIPFIRVHYETALWGVIFEIGNYPSMGKQWIVHGITKGYA